MQERFPIEELPQIWFWGVYLFDEKEVIVPLRCDFDMVDDLKAKLSKGGFVRFVEVHPDMN